MIYSQKEKKLINRASNTNTNIVKSSDSESELDQSYLDFQSQPRKKQRESDWETLDAYGITNKDRYEDMKSDYLKQDIDDDMDLSYDGSGVSGHVENYLFEPIDDIDIVDDIQESANDNSYYPVYVILLHAATTPVAVAVKLATKAQFTHCAISFDPSMRKTYTFGANGTRHLAGFIIEDIINYNNLTKKDVPYAVYMIPCTKFQIDKMKKRLDYFIQNVTKFRYDFSGLFKNFFGINDTPTYKYFCSDFVADIINTGSPKNRPYIANTFMMRPQDYTKTNFATYIHGGLLKDYNENIIKDKANKILSNLNKKIVNEEAIDNMVVNYADIKYDETAIDVAEKWAHDAMRIIITPRRTLEELDDLWVQFNSMIKKHRRESDWKSEELFGINNQTHYEYLRSQLLKTNIPDKYEDNAIGLEDEYYNKSAMENELDAIRASNNPISVAESYIDLKNKENTYYEDSVIDSSIDDSIEYFKDNIGQAFDMPMDDMPFFDPDEMKDLGVYGNDNCYGTPDNDLLSAQVTTEQWFKSYTNFFNGIKENDINIYSVIRVNKLKELYLDYNRIKESGNIEKINARKQSILELGWNPEIDFSIENRILANSRIRNRLSIKYPLKVINAKNIVNNIRENVVTTSNRDYVYFIIMDRVFGFSFDSSFNEFYSYNINTGLAMTKASINSYNKESFIKIYGVAIMEDKLSTIRDNLEKYSNSNIMDRINKNTEVDNGILLSVFISKLLDIPTEETSYIYKVYDGLLKDYTYSKANAYMNSLTSMIKEDNKIYTNLIAPYTTLRYINEMKEFPVQFDKEGNLLIKMAKKKSINFEEEYSKSHKLLLQYEKTKAYDGMKFEISKLWFLNQLLEQKRDKSEGEERYTINKVRARILNDFNKYLNVILAEESSFNFNEYYESTPFSSNGYKINKSTLKYTGDIIKGLMSGLFKK